MSRHRITGPLTGADQVIRAEIAKFDIEFWPWDLADATIPLRHLTADIAALANRFNRAAHNILTYEGDYLYPKSVLEPASRMPDPLENIGEHCRYLDRAWKSVGFYFANLHAVHHRPGTTRSIAVPAGHAADGVHAAESRSHYRLWPQDCATAGRALTDISTGLATGAHRLSRAIARLANQPGQLGTQHEAADHARTWLSRNIRPRYQTIATRWEAVTRDLEQIEHVRAGLPATPSGHPAIDL